MGSLKLTKKSSNLKKGDYLTKKIGLTQNPEPMLKVTKVSKDRGKDSQFKVCSIRVCNNHKETPTHVIYFWYVVQPLDLKMFLFLLTNMKGLIYKLLKRVLSCGIPLNS